VRGKVTAHLADNTEVVAQDDQRLTWRAQGRGGHQGDGDTEGTTDFQGTYEFDNNLGTLDVIDPCQNMFKLTVTGEEPTVQLAGMLKCDR